MTARLRDIEQFVVGSDLVEATVESLRKFGSHHLECLVLWLGKIEGTRAFVVQALTPVQESISSENGVGYFVTGETLFLLNRCLSETGLRLLAQVHSHPTDAYHSDTDDQYAIVTAEGGLSLVVPNFGNGPTDPMCWAVYRLSGGEWIELSSEQCNQMLMVIQSK